MCNKTNSASSRRSSASNGTPQHKDIAAMEKLNKNRSTWQTRSSLEAARNAHAFHSNGFNNPNNIIMDLTRPSIAPPILTSLFIITVYIACGAAAVADAQSWSYNDALYYCFVSLFTIGFGGMRPADPNMWVCALYILIGVTILSTCCHLLHQEVTTSLQKYRNVKRRNRILLTEIESANKASELSWQAEQDENQPDKNTVAVQCDENLDQCTCEPRPPQPKHLLLQPPVFSPDETLSPASSSSACSTCSEQHKTQFKRTVLLNRETIQEESEDDETLTENQMVISVWDVTL